MEKNTIRVVLCYCRFNVRFIIKIFLYSFIRPIKFLMKLQKTLKCVTPINASQSIKKGKATRENPLLCNSKNTKNSNISLDNFFSKNPHNKMFESEFAGDKPKDRALVYLKQLNDTNLYLFSEDVSALCGAKRYYIVDYTTIYYYSKQKCYHLYENYERGHKVKLHMDIDIKEKDTPKGLDENGKMEFFNDILLAFDSQF